MMRNASLLQLALAGSVVLTTTLALITLTLWQFSALKAPFVFLIPLVAGVVSFYLSLYYFKHYIDRKLKAIYRSIRKHKAPDIEQISLRKPMLDTVQDEVLRWSEQQVAELQELRKSEQYRKEFVGNVFHELKTPLFAVEGFTQTLIDGALYDPEVNLEYLHKIERNVTRLAEIVHDLETISTLEANPANIAMADFDLKELVPEVFEALEMMAEAEDITLMVDKNSPKKVMVHANRKMIHRVLENLVTNAIKYSREGEGYVKVRFNDFDDHMIIDVADNGIGLEPKDLHRVFERFYRVERSRSRALGGSGLGLAIVKHIIEAHGHRVFVRATPGQGCTFSFGLDKPAMPR